ncbi:MAG: hypothetical protein IIT53_09155 [Fibrobacter sp.]|nr:hypothetical protein [Fibrobacter sp.]
MRFWSNKFIVSIAVMLFIACGDDGASIAKPDNDAENAISSSIEESSSSSSKAKSSSSSKKSSSSATEKNLSSKASSSSQKISSSSISSSSQKQSSSSSIRSSSSFYYISIINDEFSYGEYTDPRDGQTYRTANIGHTKWLAQNMNLATETSQCYENDPAACKVQGRLYTWHDAQVVCPEGWHTPSKQEYLDLMVMAHKYDDFRYDLNHIGFSPTPSGYFYKDEFNEVNHSAYLWTSEDTLFSDGDTRGGQLCLELSLFDCYGTFGWSDKDNAKKAVRCINDTVQSFGYTGEYGKLVDERDGNEYRTVVIGNQTWIADDLRFKVSPDSNGKYSKKQLKGCDTLCPAGWHVPTEYEWEHLIKYVNTVDEFPEAVKAVDVWDKNIYGSNKLGLNITPYEENGKITSYWLAWPARDQDYKFPGIIYIQESYGNSPGDKGYRTGYLTEESARIRCLKNQDE